MTGGHRFAAPLYIAGNVAIGLGVGMAGPTLTSLRRQVGVDTGAIGVVFTAQGLGYLVASQLIARGYDRGWGHRLQGGALLVTAAALAAVPAAGSIAWLAAAFVVAGLATGTADVGSNGQMLWAKGERAGGWLAGLHLGFGAGALMSPVLARVSETTTGGVSIAFRVPALMVAVVAVGILATHGPRPAATHVRRADRPAVRDRGGVLWFVAFILLYVGGEVGFTSWLNTFARDTGSSPGGAAALNSLFWATFTIGRVANIRIAGRAGSFRPLLAASSAAVLATVPVLALEPSLMWPAVAVFGLVVGPLFPLTMALVGRRVALTGTTMGWFMGAAGLGSLTWPWLIGEMIDRHGPRAFPIAMVTLFAGATLMARVGATRLSRAQTPNDAFIAATAAASSPTRPTRE